jgi:hypothetical protein
MILMMPLRKHGTVADARNGSIAKHLHVGWELPEKRCPLRVERSLQEALFVVVPRSRAFA